MYKIRFALFRMVQAPGRPLDKERRRQVGQCCLPAVHRRTLASRRRSRRKAHLRATCQNSCAVGGSLSKYAQHDSLRLRSCGVSDESGGRGGVGGRVGVGECGSHSSALLADIELRTPADPKDVSELPNLFCAACLFFSNRRRGQPEPDPPNTCNATVFKIKERSKRQEQSRAHKDNNKEHRKWCVAVNRRGTARLLRRHPRA